MEDAATAEIGRTQLWQWARHGARLEDGQKIDQDLLAGLFEEEKQQLLSRASSGHVKVIEQASDLLWEMTGSTELVEFLTLPAYEQLQDY